MNWEIVFLPPSGENNSPEDYIDRLDNPKDKATIYAHLEPLETVRLVTDIGYIKQVQGMYQLTAGNHRLYFGIKGKQIIFVYACRKKGQKARPQDLNAAKRNFDEYINS